jgi:thiamine-monophosphate kinase
VDEFGLIRRYFTRDADSPGIVVGVGDDGALLRPAADLDQVQVIDTLVEGVHFPSDMQPADVGYRLVAVNLSDIASMGAVPRWMTLALTLGKKDEHWVAEFADGLFAAADEYNVALVGGDTTSGDAVVATVHMTGEVARGKALLRSGARPGDTIFVTGSTGDAAAGLALLQEGRHDNYLVGRFLRPSARIDKGRELAGLASAAIDVSDGLVGDLAKLLDASGAGGELDIGRLPLADELIGYCGKPPQAILFALTGGDDYELCFTAPADAVTGISGITSIGKVTDGRGVVCRHEGKIVDVDSSGYRHVL